VCVVCIWFVFMNSVWFVCARGVFECVLFVGGIFCVWCVYYVSVFCACVCV